ncbi:TonB-dependent receptor [Sphingorhabdus sp. IMCC26285]|uniref:TonB-dependent receptor n=1 Tax=Sphingorhabdus profundilacus TaxID=2509718 RepID=A0A6I4LRS3_9SPHN|nr:TonB-dependent receptor [Sphingorhabdus profundilacus]MVZ96112.1 TonB-dependent receptor [Sphingorhabdus profundilacus]
MLKPLGAISLLLLSSALVTPSMALAQDAETAQAEPTEMTEEAAEPAVDAAADPATDAAAEEEQVDVSIPGGEEIVVRGYLDRNISKNAQQVVSVLSSADIERTGEGDIAGALARVTGLSVVGNGFVYVRGLGDRYSLALLNGSPLPSPEPLKRVVPLDLFPTSVIASSLVQKTYSANFPGEFGGGVINLTTKAIPRETFLTIGGDISVNGETTNQLGYTYFGSSQDWSGFDNGNRNLKPALAAYLASGERISAGNVDTQAIAGQLVTGRNAVIQRNRNLPANGSANITGGTNFDIGDDATMGIIFNAGYSNKWRTRDTLQQTAATLDLSQKELDFQRVITDNRIVVNGLLGFGIEAGDQKIRWTNLFIRDTLKQARLGVGTRQTTSPTATLMQQDTAWFERQLIDSQLVGEFKLSPDVNLSVRVAYANSQREAPDEFSFEYIRSNQASDPFGQFFINRLNNGQQGSAEVSYSFLNEDLWAGGLDLSVKVTPDITATIGYAYSDTTRRTERRDFQFTAPSDFPNAVALFRPDFLLQPDVIDFFNIALIDTNEANPVFDARLLNNAGYGQIQAFITPEISLNLGVRYETAKQTVLPVQVFNTPSASLAATSLNESYWLPAVTLTWDITDQMKFRLSGSKTIARPQFRELIFQNYFDTDSNRLFRGNPFLTDSQLYNAEARYEWYFDRDQRFTVAGFFKRIDKPIESFSSFDDNSVITSFANAPKADLYGAEIETQKYFDLSGLGEKGFFATRRAVVIANYTYTQSKISVKAGDAVAVFNSSSTSALDFFTNGSPLTGQSDHLVNLQFGLEDTERLSQQTILLTYASERVTSRGASLQPDIKEKPGFQLDFVAREGFTIGGKEAELKFEARNLTNTKYQEFQESGENRIFYNRYRQGISASIGVEINF